MLNKPAKQNNLSQTFSKVLLPGVMSLALIMSAPLKAETASSVKTISFSASSTLDKTEKDTRLQQATIDLMPAIITQGYREESNVSPAVYATHYTASEVTLYDASTELVSDINYDGFYHRFNVVIDADTIYDSAFIYAKLYLSYEGGPWNYYASSDSFHIYSDSDQDLFIIETELADGFSPGYYDIRIELYDGDEHTRILSYGPYDDPSLSGLPLEDSYFDDYSHAVVPIETEVIITGDVHGSMGWWLFGLPVLFSVLRKRRNI